MINTRNFPSHVAVVVALLGATDGSDCSSMADAAAPNFVLILSDDQSWNGTSVQMDPNVPNSKSDYYQTPRLEQLAAEGMRFSNGYAGSPICAPTRASLQTGRSPAQLQMTDLIYALPAGSGRWVGLYEGMPRTPPMPELFDPNSYTIPRMLKDANPEYVTAHYGKWHLDLPLSTTPQAVGYDYGASLPLPPDEVDPWGVFQNATVANEFMEDRVDDNEPFFIQISQKAVHEPIRSRSVIREKYENLPKGAVHKNPAYAAMTEDLDTSVGMVMDKINELGIADNTYIIYVADNGSPVNYSNSWPLREGKSTVRDGGIRIPFIIKGPGVEAGSFSSVPVLTTDLFGTIASLAGRTEALPSNVESADLSSLLHNGGVLPDGLDHLSRNLYEGGEIVWHFPMNAGPSAAFRTRPSSAIRDGDYKLFVEYSETGGPDSLFLHDMVANISETANLAASMPAKTAELRAKLDNYLARTDASFAYDVKTPIQLAWSAGQPGKESTGWRSTIDVQYKGRETWTLGGGAEQPALAAAAGHQPGLSGSAFSFDGGDVMRRKFFHVGDVGPRKNVPSPGTPDFNRSASFDMWFRADALNHNQVLFESGDAAKGLSLTLGDADANGSFNDLRLRVLGANGQALTATVPINTFADPTTDFIHATAVFNDSDADRYVEVYVNGALAGRVAGTAGAANSLFWDGYDMAGLGKMAGAGVGANGGPGALPFNGGFTGKMAAADFWNTALTPSMVAANYNAKLHAVGFGVKMVSGGALLPAARPTNVALGAAESNSLQVIQERQHELLSALAINSVISGGGTITASNSPFSAGNLAAGTEFNSYLLHFDPTGSAGGDVTAAGSIQFAHDIVALVTDASDLVATDSILGSLGQYGPGADRGLLLAGADFVTISADRRTLSFSITLAANDVSQFRVLTAAAVQGDFNGDGIVSGDDLPLWKSAAGKSGFGDADGDHDTDGNDFLIWQRRLGATSPSTPASSTVPEPGSLASLLAAVPLGIAWRRNCRRRAA